MTYLLIAALAGGAVGAWVAWSHGILACLVAAPVGASLFALLAAAGARWWRLFRAPRPPVHADERLGAPPLAASVSPRRIDGADRQP